MSFGRRTEESTRCDIGRKQKSSLEYLFSEFQKILATLLERMEKLYEEYAKLPLIIDTPPKLARKQELEKEISQLEKDVKLIGEHEYIFVEN